MEKNKWKEYFTSSQRMSSGKKIAVVKGDRFESFLKDLSNDDSLSREARCLIICAVSGGLRFSEATSLKKESFFLEDGLLFADVDVLKKRKKEKRTILIHPSVQEFVSKYIDEKIGPLFTYGESGALKLVKRHFSVEGICNHSWRHSAISYFLFVAEMPREKVAKLIHISSKIIDIYAHLDEKIALRSAFVGGFKKKHHL